MRYFKTYESDDFVQIEKESFKCYSVEEFLNAIPLSIAAEKVVYQAQHMRPGYDTYRVSFDELVYVPESFLNRRISQAKFIDDSIAQTCTDVIYPRFEECLDKVCKKAFKDHKELDVAYSYKLSAGFSPNSFTIVTGYVERTQLGDTKYVDETMLVGRINIYFEFSEIELVEIDENSTMQESYSIGEVEWKFRDKDEHTDSVMDEDLRKCEACQIKCHGDCGVCNCCLNDDEDEFILIDNESYIEDEEEESYTDEEDSEDECGGLDCNHCPKFDKCVEEFFETAKENGFKMFFGL